MQTSVFGWYFSTHKSEDDDVIFISELSPRDLVTLNLGGGLCALTADQYIFLNSQFLFF